MYDPDPLRLGLVGSRSFGRAVLELLDHRSGVVVEQVIAPTGDALARAAGERYAGAWLSDEVIFPNCDLYIAAQCQTFIAPQVLASPKLGVLAWHPSLLPVHRGGDAVRWTIRDRDRIAGGSIYWMTDRVDAGPIARQDWCFVQPDDTASSLWRRELFPMGLRLLDAVIGDVLMGREQRRPQDETVATWEPVFKQPDLRTQKGIS
jgi:methionyl-tRNA formyltransferase